MIMLEANFYLIILSTVFFLFFSFFFFFFFFGKKMLISEVFTFKITPVFKPQRNSVVKHSYESLRL